MQTIGSLGPATMDADAKAQLAAWVAETVGGPVTRFEPHFASGRTRAMWSVEAQGREGPLRMILRQDTGASPFTGTCFTLKREAGVISGLAGSGVPVARIFGVTPDETAVLMGLLPGASALDYETPEGRSAMDDFMDTLAFMHGLDGAALPLGLAVPKTPQEHILLDLADHYRSFKTVCGPSPVVDEAYDWLAAHAPQQAPHTALCQGDCGPGNFMHENGRVTGVIDWEMAHLGEAADDLAWLWFRITMLRQGGELASAFRRYEQASGAPIDLKKVSYYCAMVFFRCVVTSLTRYAHVKDAFSEESAKRTQGWMRTMLDAQAAGGVGATGALPPLPGMG